MGRFEGRYITGKKCPDCGANKVFKSLGGLTYECDECTNYWSVFK